jgi:hypothetical protein
MWRSGAPIPVLATIAILAISCRPHKVPPPAEAPTAHSWYWIDLHAGWRVRVVTPVTKSGGYLVVAEPVASTFKSGEVLQVSRQAPGAATIDLKAGKDFIGYEVSLYSIKSRRGGGVRIRFCSAVINEEGKKTARTQPVLPMFRLPGNDRFVRVLHLGRGSHGDHDAAILATINRDSLDSLAKRVARDPSACVTRTDGYCSWVPAGVAVIPEHRKNAAGGSKWTAAY